MLRWKVAKLLLHSFRVVVSKNLQSRDFPGGPVDKNPFAAAGDTGWILVREGPTCRGAAKLALPDCCGPRICSPCSSMRSPRNEKPVHHSEDPCLL